MNDALRDAARIIKNIIPYDRYKEYEDDLIDILTSIIYLEIKEEKSRYPHDGIPSKRWLLTKEDIRELVMESWRLKKQLVDYDNKLSRF